MVEILAGFFDPSNDGFDILDTAQIIGLVVAITGLVAMYWRWHSKQAGAIRKFERQEMKAEILDALDDRTQQIQPGYRNGGESLADISWLSKAMLSGQEAIRKDLAAIRHRLDDHIDNHHGKGDE